MTDLNYVHQRFQTAVDASAAAEGTLKERLTSSYRSNCAGVELTEGSDQDLRDRISALANRLSSTDGPDGRIAASIEAMDGEEVLAAAQEVVDIFFAVNRELLG